MSTIVQKVFPIVAGLVLATAMQGECLAQYSAVSSDTTRKVSPHIPAVPITPSTVVATYANAGSGPTAISADKFTDYDKFKVKCPQATCTLLISVMQQATGAADPSKPWSIYVTVDGTGIDGGPFVGNLPSFSVVANWQGHVSVAKGVHTVSFKTYGQADFFLDKWNDRVIVTTP
jgi:hypothetical protein